MDLNRICVWILFFLFCDDRDCDNDENCDLGLVCQERKDDESVFGCTGTGIDSVDYCIKPREGQLVKVADNRAGECACEKYPAAMFPLKRCQGDCDHNNDCDGDLICFERDSYEAVPGCSGKGISGTDYCVSPNDVNGTATNDASTSSSFPPPSNDALTP